jgi:hypothetical protein
MSTTTKRKEIQDILVDKYSWTQELAEYTMNETLKETPFHAFTDKGLVAAVIDKTYRDAWDDGEEWSQEQQKCEE